MVGSKVNPDAGNGNEAGDPLDRKKASLSMHDNVPVWYDCCSCEAEPYWLDAMCFEAEQQERDSD